MAATRSITISVRQPETAVNDDHDEAEDSLNRFNSFFHRTTTRTRTFHHDTSTGKSILDTETPDFLRLVTAIQGLYSQRDVIEMQQLDRSTRKDIGSGAIFQVSTVNTESNRPSETMANTTIRHECAVILKRSPIPLYQANGSTKEGSEATHAAASFIMELRILSHPNIRADPNVVSLLGVGWEYCRSASTALWHLPMTKTKLTHLQPDAFPEPNLMLEKAYGTLHEFQHKSVR
jgi:hypothetical protein